MAAREQQCSLVYRQPGSFPPETLGLPADVLADVEGKTGSVTLVETGAGRGEACWDDGGVPRRRAFETVSPETLPPLPELPAHWQPVEPAFLRALAEATRTTARDGVRYSLARIQLRGRGGRVVATDGRQLLVQGGFSLPWADDVLLPALPLFVSRDLPSEGPIALGRTRSHVGLRVGPWAFVLEIDDGGRYPEVDGVIPRMDRTASRLHLSEEDARFLLHVLPRLPGRTDDLAPVTLDLGEQAVLRTRADDSAQMHEVFLSGSTCAGPAVRLACNRRYLARLVQLGFREVQVCNANTPLLCRDPTRTYLFMPLDRPLPPAVDAVRLVSARPLSPPSVRNRNPKTRGEEKPCPGRRPPRASPATGLPPRHRPLPPREQSQRPTRSGRPRRCERSFTTPRSGWAGCWPASGSSSGTAGPCALPCILSATCGWTADASHPGILDPEVVHELEFPAGIARTRPVGLSPEPFTTESGRGG